MVGKKTYPIIIFEGELGKLNQATETQFTIIHAQDPMIKRKLES
jgi:hypothetical protein